MSALLLIIACFLLVALGLLSGCEMGLYSLNRVRLRIRAGQDSAIGQQGRLLLDLEKNRQQAVIGILLWQNIAGYLLTVVAARWLAGVTDMDPQNVDFFTALLLTPIVFVLGDVTPKNWFQIEADRLMYPVARPLHATVHLLRATRLPALLERLARAVVRLGGEEPQQNWLGARGEIMGLIRESAADGVLSEEQTQIIERVLNLSRVQVRSVMIPRQRVVTVPVDINRRDFEAVVRGHSYSRMPVLGRDGTVLGTVKVPQVLASEGDLDLSRHLRPPVSIADRDSAASALIQMQRGRSKIAIVTDPRHGFVGIVTLKDLVEEIFGELPAW